MPQRLGCRYGRACVELGETVAAGSYGGAHRGVGLDPPLDLRLLDGVEQAEHVFVGQFVDVVVLRAHAMQSLSEASPRRTQAFAVPSGIFSLPAISP